MENTEHYRLNLPEGDDIYNVRDFNHNSIILDNLVYASNENIQVIQGDIHDVKEDINGIESDINDIEGDIHDIEGDITEIEDEIQGMKTTFQAGVDACFYACDDKGSTPESHALADVVEAIYNIDGGGGGESYYVEPQMTSLGEIVYANNIMYIYFNLASAERVRFQSTLHFNLTLDDEDDPADVIITYGWDDVGESDPIAETYTTSGPKILTLNYLLPYLRSGDHLFTVALYVRGGRVG